MHCNIYFVALNSLHSVKKKNSVLHMFLHY